MDSVYGSVLAIVLVVVLIAIYVYFNPDAVDNVKRRFAGGDSSPSDEALIGSHKMEASPSRHTSKTEMSVDMVDYRHDDPKFSKYTRRLRDTVGMDGSDYYYENDTLYRQGVMDAKEGIAAFESTAGLRSETIPGQRGDWRSTVDFENGAVVEDTGFGDGDQPSSFWHGSVASAEPAIGGAEDLELLRNGLSFTGHRNF